jgi:small subunit ribosomal protein S8
MTDPIAAMLIMIKNASRVKGKTVTVPYSKLKHSIADCLEKEGYLAGVNKKVLKNMPVLVLDIAYEGGAAKLTDLKRISKPSLRVYAGVKDLRPVRQGYGIMVLSTPKGILTDREAKRELVGGEVICKLW